MIATSIIILAALPLLYIAYKRIKKHYAKYSEYKKIVTFLLHHEGFFHNGMVMALQDDKKHLYLESLQEQLQKALAKEDYDLAARIHNFILDYNQNASKKS
jgi:protein-arginine kinase activator protein McsA